MFDYKRLRERRLEMGLTLEEVGAVVGISRSGVQKHEKGIIKNVYISTVELFAQALRCSPAYLMGWTDNPSLNNAGVVPNILRQYNRLDTPDKTKAASYIEGLLAADKYLDGGASISEDIADTIAATQKKKIPIKQK